MNNEFTYKTLREEVVIYLRKRILTGEIKPGERINELETSKKLNISRGPVREALRQIEQEGLASYYPNKGCTVKTISPSDMSEVYLLRSTLEILAVKIYSGNMKDSSIEKLEKFADNMGDMSNKNNLYNIVENDENFHSTIVEEAGIKLLYNTWKGFEGENAAIYYTMSTYDYAPRNVRNNHYIIIDALKERDLDKICRTIQEHYMVVPKYLYKAKNMESDKIVEFFQKEKES